MQKILLNNKSFKQIKCNHVNENYSFKTKGSNKIIIRTMMSTRNFTPIIKLTPYTISIRNHPGEFKLRRWTPLNADEKRRLNLTQHETTHYTIEEVKTKKIKMLLTSAKGKNNTENEFYKLSPEKVNGSYTPLLNPRTKELLMDDYGYTIPNPNKGGQYVTSLQTAREIGKDIQHKYKTMPEFQAYLDKHETTLKNILDKQGITTTLARKIGGQDDE